MAEATIQTGDNGAQHGRRWLTVVLIVVGLAAMFGIGAGVRWYMNRHNSKAQPPTAQTAKPATIINDSAKLLAEGKRDEANASIEKSLQNPSLSKDDKYELYMEQGRVASDAQNYQAAYDAFKNALANKETFDVVRKLGGLAQMLGKNDEALADYKRAKEINPKDSPTYESDNNVLQQQINALEGN